MSDWAEKEKAERDRAYRGGEGAAANLLGAVEKEIVKLHSDATRLKGRQDALEGILTVPIMAPVR